MVHSGEFPVFFSSETSEKVARRRFKVWCVRGALAEDSNSALKCL